MSSFEADQARPLTAVGVLLAHGIRFKMYHLNSAPASDAALDRVLAALPAQVVAMGDSNGLGFVIQHPGSAGLTVNAFWGAQGSVLCQQHLRQPYGAAPLGPRPVIGCVWELDVIAHEQAAWRCHMMQDAPRPQAYLDDWAPHAEAAA